jgi:N4-gp56 family major capsid protein
MRRYNPLLTAMVPLGNTGVNVGSQVLTAVDIDAKIGFYGTYVVINEQVTLQSQDPVLNECAARLGVSLRQTEDQLTRDMLAATAAFVNSTGGNNGDNPTEITRKDINDVVRTLLGNNAYTILDNIEGQDKFATAPVRDAYFALCHTDLTSNLDAVNGFIQKNSYPSPMEALRSEWGAAGNLRFLISSIGSKIPNASAFSKNVYNVYCVGMEAYSCIEQDRYSAQFVYRPPIYDGPLAQNCSVGYKFAEVPRILNDLWVLNLRCTLAV